MDLAWRVLSQLARSDCLRLKGQIVQRGKAFAMGNDTKTEAPGDYLKWHTEALIKDLGYLKACEVSAK